LYHRPGPYLIEEQLHQGITPKCCLGGPVAEVPTGKIDPDASELRLLAIERNRITELAHQHECQQPRGGDALLDNLSRNGGNLHRVGAVQPLALLADVFEPNVVDDLQLGGNDIKLLRGFLPHAYQRRPATADLLAFGNVVHHLLAKQIGRKGPPPSFGSLVSSDLDRCLRRRG
jgi:hypothetical protein